MSGGSWDYLYLKVEDAANELIADRCAVRRAFGKHLLHVAHAMHEIEWVDSGDKSPPADTDAIRSALGDSLDGKVMETLLEDARNLISKLKEFGA